jgi:hypothetical protein
MGVLYYFFLFWAYSKYLMVKASFSYLFNEKNIGKNTPVRLKNGDHFESGRQTVVRSFGDPGLMMVALPWGGHSPGR